MPHADLRLWTLMVSCLLLSACGGGGSGLIVTLIEPNPLYASNIMSNLVLRGTRTLSSLNFSHATLISRYGIQLKQANLLSFSPATAQAPASVLLSDNTSLTADHIVMAPGIVFDDAYGLTNADYQGDFPHAWQAGTQTHTLAAQITAMQAGDTLIMSIPAKPYRCPPGPYERACLIADYLKSQGKTGAKVVVLDENPGIQTEPANFTTAFNSIHTGWIDYRPSITNIQVDKATRTVSFTQNGSTQSLSARVISLIPPHRAPAFMTPLLAGGRWAPVNVLNYASSVSGMNNIHIIGDASLTTQPKAGHMANQQAKVCADAIIRALQGQAPDSAPVTNSACYSPITATTASWLTAVYQYDPVSQSMKIGQLGQTGNYAATESASISSGNFSRMNTWFNTLMQDSFS